MICFSSLSLSLCRWISSLRQAHVKETTVKHYAQNVAQFMDYLAETPPSTCRLTKTVLIALRREMRQILKSMRRGVVAHQAAVKASKEERVIPKETLRKCRELSKEAIPKLLGKYTLIPSIHRHPTGQAESGRAAGKGVALPPAACSTGATIAIRVHDVNVWVSWLVCFSCPGERPHGQERLAFLRPLLCVPRLHLRPPRRGLSKYDDPGGGGGEEVHLRKVVRHKREWFYIS